MEVHAHTHTPAAGHRKKWTHYLWEFLMLFLAVFCGFLAENQREHMVEHQREKKYIKLIHYDLKKDTAFYTFYRDYLIRAADRLDSVVNMLGTGEYQKRPDYFYTLCIRAWASRFFNIYSTTFDQMKSSGNLRLIREDSVIQALMDYYHILEKGVNNLAEMKMNKNDLMITAMLDFLDAGYFRGDSLTGEKGAFGFFTAPGARIDHPDPEKKNRVVSACLQKKMVLIGLYNSVLKLKMDAAKLIELLNGTYHLE